MGAVYNAIAFASLATFLKGLGFTPTTIHTKDGHEVVFERRHHGDDQLIVLVYTSASPEGVAVRGKGKDAIRVCLVCESDRVASVQRYYGKKPDGRKGLGKATRVNRVGTTESIFGRIRTRAREMYTLANQMHRGEHCTCGAPRYPDTGKCVLAGYCADKSKDAA